MGCPKNLLAGFGRSLFAAGITCGRAANPVPERTGAGSHPGRPRQLPVSALFGTDAIPPILDGKEKRVRVACKGFDERRYGGHTDLNIQSLSEGIVFGKMPRLESAALSDLVDHQFRLAQAEITEAFLLALISAIETEDVAVKRLRPSPVRDGKLRDQCIAQPSSSRNGGSFLGQNCSVDNRLGHDI